MEAAEVRLAGGKMGAGLFGLAWAIVAVASVALRQYAGALPMIWLPTAMSVAVLYSVPRKEWRFYLAAMAVAGFATNYWAGFTLLETLGCVAAVIIEPVFVVVIAKRIVGRRQFHSLRLPELIVLTLTAVMGALLGALVAIHLYTGQAPLVVAWWILASSLGTTVGAPLLVAGANWLRRQQSGWRQMLDNIPVTFLLVQVAMLLLSLVVLSMPYFSLTQLVLAALVFSVIRYGQIAGTAGAFTFGLAATILSIGGHTPAAYLPYGSQLAQGAILQGFMFLMLATSLPLAGLFMRNNQLALRLKARNAKMRENLLMLNMAEEVGRIGRWRYDRRTDAQDWSRQMYLINGLDPNRGRDPGNMKDLLPDGGEELFGHLKFHARDRAPYSFEYRIRLKHGDERILKMYATNEFAADGEPSATFGVVMDVTEHRQRQEALDNERTRAMRLAAEAQYLAHTDSLTGLANRRRAITQLDKNIRRCEQGKRPLGVISFDIDHFKRVNDTEGHQKGDDVLIRIAEIAREQARASDLVGRMGGEEFIWLLPDAGPEETRKVAERLRQTIEQESSRGGLPRVTASIGYAMWRPGDDANALLARVDSALYAAKAAGRNTVEMAA